MGTTITKTDVLRRMDAAYERMARHVKPPKSLTAPPMRKGFALHPDYAITLEPLKKPNGSMMDLEYRHKGFPVVVYWDAADNQHVFFGDLNALPSTWPQFIVSPETLPPADAGG